MIDIISGQDISSYLTIALRILFSIGAGFIIGLERSTRSQPAGVRTHMVLALGACGIMITSILLPLQFSSTGAISDPGRLAAQVISGIGFLGAGAILRLGFNIQGLTTAASIWTTSGIGLMFGAGLYFLGGLCTLLLFFILRVVDMVEEWMFHKERLRSLKVSFNDEKLQIKSVVKVIKKYVDIKKFSFTEEVKNSEVEIEVICKMREDQSIREIFEDIKSLGNIISLKIE